MGSSTVPVSTADLRVGDVIRWPDGRYYAVHTAPRQGPYREEYSEPLVAVGVTEVSEDLTPVAPEAQLVHAPDAVVDVLEPRPDGS